ncbi:LOW QUALITY PROTEIN: hypothetical protein Scep_001029 [Stephania cephalantha]|uniref:Glycosyltransferase n=1 Tax=Stephania cephalantha TaxID=152367 RepID=A0AAP0L776_9MAGN
MGSVIEEAQQLIQPRHHVVMVSLAQQGHINPMLRFAKVLVSKGLHVTLATTEEARDRLLSFSSSSSTLTPSSATTSPKIDFEFFSDGFSPDYDRLKNVDHYVNSLPIYAANNFKDLLSSAHLNNNKNNISCVITNIFFPSAIDVAEELGIPCALLWIQTCALYSIYYRYYKNLNDFPSLHNLDLIVDDLPGIPRLGIDDLPAFIHPSDPFPSFNKWLSYLIENLGRVKWVLGSSFYELEKEIVDSMTGVHPIAPIGPLVPSVLLGVEETVGGSADLWKPQDSCLAWLDTKPRASVVYISFGSTGVLSAKQMENMALALKESKRPFLWAVKPASGDDGRGEVPKWFAKESKEQEGLVVPWCSQVKVLMHEAVGCFVSHCGWNSGMETLAAGVPLVAFPLWTDQPTNARLFVEVFGTGVSVRVGGDGVVSKEEIGRCIGEVMDEGEKAGELRAKAEEWRNAARVAVAKGGSSDRNLELFIADILSSS